ncbi:MULTISPECIES: hypothetical protein [unclassified Micromonospora]|uniref:hypothetical protein n=1 Tax=unclassified Micromonospora TaxID=2617518 RepID=UPI0022B6350A|nr:MULTISPECIES: hypothetical protein [unclassified Micromonospora]MCZ7421632.1 hypothetical protein [Verrucosispora sp. WMMA2121]WBB93687.1 hypothetical protein O7597_12290 [Verrucosispora sp. WMMC514]
MTEAARKVAEQTEQRLDDLAEDVQRRFDRITKGRVSDQVQAGRFSGRGDRVAADRGQVGRGAGQVRSDQHRRERGGSR